jgi:hypothetical protein
MNKNRCRCGGKFELDEQRGIRFCERCGQSMGESAQVEEEEDIGNQLSMFTKHTSHVRVKDRVTVKKEGILIHSVGSFSSFF